MARPIVMPSMSMYAAEGTLVAWLRPAGSAVQTGEPVAEVSTEKASFEIEAPAAGILHPIATVGAVLAIEAVMGYVLAEGDALPVAPAATLPPHDPQVSVPVSTRTPRMPPPPVVASPIARRLAAQHGIDLALVVGSGPGGRIVEADVLAAATSGGNVEATPSPRHAPRILKWEPMTGIRRTVAERLRRSVATAVSTTLSREADADVLVAVRERLTERIRGELPFDALFIKVFAAALREHPELNASIEDEVILTYDDVHVGFAVSAPAGLLVPVVRNADKESLAAIARQVLDLAERARAGRLIPEEMSGGTATISNLGAYGVDVFTPILNPPQSVILGIGRISARPVVRNGSVVPGRRCALSLTFDHRVTDGASAARLLDAVARHIADEAYLLTRADPE
jgi:pyruvate dehydrogenase E2 component (dihydrolipoamide acetyltransferase)